MLSNSMSQISDKVARASKAHFIYKTQAIRVKLAAIYALMFEFYHKAIEWYLDSRIGRAFRSFNENLKSSFESTKTRINEEVQELYFEAQISNSAMVSVLYGKFEELPGAIALKLLEESWREGRPLRQAQYFEAVERGPLSYIQSAQDGSSQVKEVISLTEAREYIQNLERFIVGEEGPTNVGAGSFWVAEEEVLPKLRDWMTERSVPRTLWISSPYERGSVTSARASAMAVVAAAWHAKAPIISYFCKRPQQDELRAGMSIEQVGLMSLIYSLIYQLLQFSRTDDTLDISEESLKQLNGEMISWETGLEVLETLLDQTPVLTYCVIDGLNDLELGNGAEWCVRFLKLLFKRQKQAGTNLNILLTTAGQSQILAQGIKLEERHHATKPARELVKRGRRIDL